MEIRIYWLAGKVDISIDYETIDSAFNPNPTPLNSSGELSVRPGSMRKRRRGNTGS